jgi:hypothetical protein
VSDEHFEQLLAELGDELDAREREELVAILSMAVEPVEPDPAVRARVMERIARARPPAPALAPAAPLRARRDLRPFAAAAAAAGLAALVTYSVMAPDAAPAPPAETARESEPAAGEAGAELAELEAQIDEQDEEIAALESELDRAREALSVLGAKRVERLDLVSAPHPEVAARVYWDWDEYSCWFVAEGLPALAAGRRYALWLFTDAGEVIRAGDFDAGGSEGASFFAMLPKDLGKVVRAVVTEEPDPPGDAPTGEAVLEGPATRAS